MNWQTYIRRSIAHYWRNHLTVMLGVAVATAVLVGALIVGDSMRGSLRAITLQRLGKIDDIVLSGNFFGESLIEQIKTTDTYKDQYSNAEGIIYFPKSTTELTDGSRRATDAGLIACQSTFWDFDNQGVQPSVMPEGQQVVINQTMAEQLGITASDLVDDGPTIKLRVPAPKAIAADSAMSKKDDTIVSLVDFRVVDIIPDSGLGRFGIRPTQIAPPNAFIPLDQMQRALRTRSLQQKSNSQQVNMILLAGKGETPPTEVTTNELEKSLEPSLEDLGLYLTAVNLDFEDSDGQTETIYDYFSLSTDRMVLPSAAVAAATDAFPDSDPVLTYLANKIELVKDQDTQVDEGDEQAIDEDAIPFSMVTAIGFGDEFDPRSQVSGEPITAVDTDAIVLTQWAAEDLGAKVGDTVRLTFFDPETADGNEVERSAEFRLADIAALTAPATPFGVRRRQEVRPPTFKERPTQANDWNLTPFVPGITDAVSIQRWDLPFQTLVRTSGKDDDYWKFYRTTPKAFVNLDKGRQLWTSRFGNTTSLRIPHTGQSLEEVEASILDQFRKRGKWLDLHVTQIKRQGLTASSGSTPFDALFLGLSMFVIASSVLLVALLFRLGAARRAEELGLLYSVGTRHKTVFWVWIIEAVFVCLIGAAIGVLGGLGYAQLMIYGLKTWWVGAISTPFLNVHVGWLSILIGFVCGTLICVLSIGWSLWNAGKLDPQRLLMGQFEDTTKIKKRDRSRLWAFVAVICVVIAIVLSIVAALLGGEMQAGAFMGSGFMVLAGALIGVRLWLGKRTAGARSKIRSVGSLAQANIKRYPLRSWLTIALVAVASFLLIAVSSFRLQPTERGTGGFSHIARTDTAVLYDLNKPGDQTKMGIDPAKLDGNYEVIGMRVQDGDDASCTNPFQTIQPRVLSIDKDFVGFFDDAEHEFAWSGTAATTENEKSNPWHVVDLETENDIVPVVIDKNTAWYSLKVYSIGQEFTLNYDTVGPITFKLVGLLENTVLQGSLMISEQHFSRLFPSQSGPRMFLLDTSAGNVDTLNTALSEYGWSAISAEKELAGFLAVQNTYLNTFQSLGGLGLLLGTFGLAVVQMRTVVERQKEIALLRAVGFSAPRLATLIAMESFILLGCGLLVGIGAALCSVIPHIFVTQLSLPWEILLTVFATIVVVGILTGIVGARIVSRAPVVSALRG